MSTWTAIDPGPVSSAWVELRTNGAIGSRGIGFNADVLEIARNCQHRLAIEAVSSYGMPVGKEVFETVFWIGRFYEANVRGNAWHCDPLLVYRKQVTSHLCHSVRAGDSNVRQALIDLLGPPGVKASPGATYGIVKDVWQALGVAVTARDMELGEV